MSGSIDLDAEWLEADGLGGFASGTVGLVRTRRYHALLLTATTPPAGRVVLVNGIEAWLETGTERIADHAAKLRAGRDLSGRRAAGSPRFATTPWPTWRFRPARRHDDRAARSWSRATRCETVLRWRRDGGPARAG